MTKQNKVKVGIVLSVVVSVSGLFVLLHSDTSTFCGVVLLLIGNDMKDDILDLARRKD